jgi:hypothetical protein
MHWLLGFLFALSPAILAQLRGHHAASAVILLNLGGLAGLIMGMMYVGTAHESPVYASLGAIAWLGAFLWSFGR